MTDEELIARVREVGERLRRRLGDLDREAGWLMKELAARLEARPAAQAEVWAFCKRCEAGTASVQCPQCGGPACANCGRCPPCDGPPPDKEDDHG